MISTDLRIPTERAKASRITQIDFNSLEFGAVYSDHMLVMDYQDGAWQAPHIAPFQQLSMSPATAALHYGQTIFEGLKAYRGEDELLIFRPQAHAQRFNKSAERLCMPHVEEEVFVEGLSQLLQLDQQWVPSLPGCSLYIRPMMYASDEFIRVKPSGTYRFIIFTSPVSAYYSGTVKVIVETNYVRASEGGIGFAKAGGNYAASLLPAKLAAEKGYQQILWTDSKEHQYFEESGTMNIVFQLGDTLVTPPLSTSILAGVTRNSLIAIAKRKGIQVEERRISIKEVTEAHAAGRLRDAFGVGTAATITHISTIHYEGVDMELPEVSTRKISTGLAMDLNKIRMGHAEDPFNWVHRVKL